MGETETFHFYDFGIFGYVPEPQNQYYLSLETPECLNKSELTNQFWKICLELCFKSKILKTWERRAPNNHEDPFKISWKPWVWDQSPPENIESKFGESLWVFEAPTPRNFETKKLWNQEILKPRNSETKELQNQETKNHGTKNPPTPQHNYRPPPLHPTTFFLVVEENDVGIFSNTVGLICS